MPARGEMVRRAAFLVLLCLLMLGGGIYTLAAASGPGFFSGDHAHIGRLAGAGMLFIAAVAALMGTLFPHQACRRLTERLQTMLTKGRCAHVECPHPDLTPLVSAINGVVDSAEQAIADAAMRVRELDLQLKVTTAERQHLEAIIHSISDAVLVTDPFDEVVLANDSAARTFNFELHRASRRPIQEVLDDPAMIALVREMRKSNSRSGRRILEHRTTTPAGERAYKVTLSCIAGQGEEPSGVVAVLHDITREKEVAQMKNDFVSSVSHELRTPLASIKAYAEMLIDGEAADQKTAHEFYEVIHNEANRLGRLIDNILNVSRIESGLVKINKKPQSLTMLLKEAVDVIAPQARQKSITVEEEISPAFYQTLCDRDMLYESVLNLLSNAVKYTPERGRVLVQTVVDESKKTVAVRITDTGVGIPPKDLPFVFDKFYRSEANSRMAKGTGLGLSLVKHVIEAVHHGRLFVESDVGKGSTFGFELDLTE